MVLEGKVNSEIVSAMNIYGPHAIGVSGGAAGSSGPRRATPNSDSSVMSPR
jgi:acetylglutamate kinase